MRKLTRCRCTGSLKAFIFLLPFFGTTIIVTSLTVVMFRPPTAGSLPGVLRPTCNFVKRRNRSGSLADYSLEMHPHCKPSASKALSSKDLTIAVLFHNDKAHLEAQVVTWLKLSEKSRQQLVFVIVDDGSLIHAAKDLVDFNSECAIDIMIVRILDDISWNIGGARNLAMFVAPTEYVFLTDVDIHLPLDIFSHLLRIPSLAERRKTQTGSEHIYTQFSRMVTPTGEKKPHPAVMLLSKTAYWKVGGCDEDFVGQYGYTDPHFWHRATLTPNISKVICVNEHAEFPSLIEHKELSSHTRERNRTRNKIIFEQKAAENKWSDVYIRYEWTIEQSSCLDALIRRR